MRLATSFCNTTSRVLKIKHFLSQGCSSFIHLKAIHAHLLRLSINQNPFFIDMILRAYFDFVRPDQAYLVFSHATRPNIFLWNTMIRGFVAHDWFSHATEFYGGLLNAGLSPNNFTFPFVFKACARLLDLELGRRIHAHVVKLGFEFDVFVKTGTISMYAKCGYLGDARKLFDEMPVGNVVSWTSMISGYIEDEQYFEAVDLFGKMLMVGLRPDEFTLTRVLSACAHSGDVKNGEWIHRYIEEKCLEQNVVVATSLIDMYAKCGQMEKARWVFDRMKQRDVVSWSTMISAYSLNGLPKEALDVFYMMQQKNVKPDGFTVVGVLSACARLGALELGNKVRYLVKEQEFMLNPVLGTALVDMYAKCGSITHAWDVFRKMEQKDIVVWNSMISGLSMSGYVEVALGLFNGIGKLGFKPNGNTFVGLLCGCTHAGLVDEGRQFFNCMINVYCLTPTVEHYGCLVDLLGRAGNLDEAHEVIKHMPLIPNVVVWGALLASCRNYKDTHLAEHALKHLIELEPSNAGNYVLLSNIYSTSGRWDDASELRLLMSMKGIQKTPGCSWIEVRGLVHEFHVGDHSHPMSEQIYSKLNELNKEIKALGYVPSTDGVLFDLEVEEKEHFLGHHSEKLAVTFGLIATTPGQPIRVVKNLRICGDCHTAIKFISKISACVIIVRDSNRFHSFEDGMCSCKDFW